MSKPIEKQIVEAILEELSGRGGFDGFWDGCDKETQKEIKQTLTVKVGEIFSLQDKAKADEADADREFTQRIEGKG